MCRGIRAVVGLICIGFPSAYCGSPDNDMETNIKAYVDKGVDIRETIISKMPLVTCTIAPHAPYTVSSPHHQNEIILQQRRSRGTALCFPCMFDLLVNCHISQVVLAFITSEDACDGADTSPLGPHIQTLSYTYFCTESTVLCAQKIICMVLFLQALACLNVVEQIACIEHSASCSSLTVLSSVARRA